MSTTEAMAIKQAVTQARRKEKKKIKKKVKKEMQEKGMLPKRAEGTPGRIMSSLPIDYGNQQAFQTTIDTEQRSCLRKYLKCLLAPQAADPARIPDSFAQPTALVASPIVLSIPVFNTSAGTGDAGRFSLLINPSMGDPGSPNTYKVAVVDASTSWPTDFSKAASFNVTLGSIDVRMDPFTQQMLLANRGSAVFTAANPVNPSTQASNLLTTAASFSVTAGYGLTPVINTDSFMTLPIGFYSVTIMCNAQNGTTGAASPTPIIVGTQGSAQVFPEIVASAYCADDNTVLVWSGYVLIPDNTARINAVTANNQYSYFTALNIATAYDDIAGMPVNNGAMKKYRPVAMSCLASYIGPLISNGGMIASCFLPGGEASSQFFVRAGSDGCLANWDYVAQQKGNYNGPIDKGAYVWYSPTDISDYNMRVPSDAATYSWPSLVVSGQYMPGTGGSISGNVIRVMIWTIYEFETTSPLWVSQYQKGSQADMDMVLQHLVGLPHAMANGDHVNFIQKVVSAFAKGAKFIKKNKKPIGKMLDSGVELLGELL